MPEDGVKVYNVVPDVAVLTEDGFHVPLIAGELVEFVGKTGAVAFWQTAAIGSKVGVSNGETTTSISARRLSQVPIVWLT